MQIRGLKCFYLAAKWLRNKQSQGRPIVFFNKLNKKNGWRSTPRHLPFKFSVVPENGALNVRKSAARSRHIRVLDGRAHRALSAWRFF